MTYPDSRYKQRFAHFEHALVLLRNAVEPGTATLSPLEREGVVQRFEYTFELAWKTLKDYLGHEGMAVVPTTAQQVFKAAVESNIISDEQIWIAMLDHVAFLAHTYEAIRFEQAVDAIASRYLPALTSMHGWFQQRQAAE
jgi:nucleotidyltransferase substrate binding protein (TIGR01987 family)